ncbi:transposable element Tc1 transposase [Trichonephila clavipes]|uniref:Transposable element Tc1 transposase n=1 Tax=Trichonephila clavipes TaxID=2585209 RepID=A0A8X6SA60_TRICX|nr:transposable element Tc1 transposase [Trichonephila clavipes]
MINGCTRLHVVANGTMTGQRYIDEVLLPHVRLFRGAVGDKFVFMDDNATYLNPIENVWDALGRQVAGRNYPPTNKNTLIRALIEEWDKLPQQLLDNVVQSMVRRVECCITLHGGHIPTATAGSDVVQSERPIFDDFFQHLWPYIGNNTANVVFQMVKRLWLIRIDQ